MEPRRRPIDYGGISVLVLALGLSFGWAVAPLIAVLYGYSLGPGSAEALATVGGAMVGVVATAVGSRMRNGHHNGTIPTPTPAPPAPTPAPSPV